MVAEISLSGVVLVLMNDVMLGVLVINSTSKEIHATLVLLLLSMKIAFSDAYILRSTTLPPQ